MHLALALALALTAMLSPVAQPATAPVTAPTSATFALPPALDINRLCEEDEPCWDCDTMGNTHCANPALEEAWDTLDTLDIDLDGPNDDLVIEYRGKTTKAPKTLPLGQFYADSADNKGAFIIFEYVQITQV
jgi:hypothetical protein